MMEVMIITQRTGGQHSQSVNTASGGTGAAIFFIKLSLYTII